MPLRTTTPRAAGRVGRFSPINQLGLQFSTTSRFTMGHRTACVQSFVCQKKNSAASETACVTGCPSPGWRQRDTKPEFEKSWFRCPITLEGVTGGGGWTGLVPQGQSLLGHLTCGRRLPSSTPFFGRCPSACVSLYGTYYPIRQRLFGTSAS